MGEDYRCGFAALIGRPNAGKSTLLNTILGTKLAITSAKPQTTRDRIVGIHSTEDMQAVLVDTPGIHDAWTELNKVMVAKSVAALQEVDVVLWLADMTHAAARLQSEQSPMDAVDELIAAELSDLGRPVILVANKMDVVASELALPVIAAWQERLSLATAVPTSAVTGDGVPELLAEVRSRLPVHPPLYPPEHWADISERFLAAEIIREKIFHLTEQEIPYSTFVEIERFDESERETRNIVRIYARIALERRSQKGIVIGRRGEMLKRIGTLARKELQKLLECRVYLELYVNVEPDWTRTRRGLRRVGFVTE